GDLLLFLLRRPIEDRLKDAPQHWPDAGGAVLAKGEGWVLLHIGDLRQLQLEGVDAFVRPAIVPGDVAALEATIEYAGVALGLRRGFEHPGGELRRRRTAPAGAD